MSDLVGRLRWHGNPNQRALLSEAADRIEELEAALAEATKGLDYYEECMALRAENKRLNRRIKGEEVETPDNPSTDDQVPLPSNEETSDLVLQADFQVHKRDMALHQQAQSERNLWVTDRLEDQERRIRTLEARIQSTSPNASYRYSDWSEEGNASSPASHGSEDKTPDPHKQIWWSREEFADAAISQGIQPTQRRSGKDRRESKIEQTTSERHYVIEQKIYPTRRKISRRKQPTPDIEQQ